ncbi:MAG: LysR family transcriptional regulator [Gammaproteobacteria bacterium]|nr:LysR family transcriptional regulator [Gammaproteobacteria bacterium]
MSKLNYHHLYYFWKVANQGNLTQTARNLHVSQSALSTQIKQLETIMKVKLFEREGRKLTLTDSGARVLAYANEIFSIGEELESVLKQGIEHRYRRVRIGSLATMSRNFIEAFVAPLLTQQGVHFSLHAGDMDNLLDGLARHELDLVLSNVNVDFHSGPLWQSQLLARQPLSVVGPPALKPEQAFPLGYDTLRWVLPAVNTPLRIAFDGFCKRWQFTPTIHGEADDMAMLRLLARDSGALAVVPEVVVRDEIQQGILQRYMILPNVFEHFYAITIKQKFVPDTVRDLMLEFDSQKVELGVE